MLTSADLVESFSTSSRLTRGGGRVIKANTLEVCLYFVSRSLPTERPLIYLVAVIVIIAALAGPGNSKVKEAIWFTMIASALLNWKVV